MLKRLITLRQFITGFVIVLCATIMAAVYTALIFVLQILY